MKFTFKERAFAPQNRRSSITAGVMAVSMIFASGCGSKNASAPTPSPSVPTAQAPAPAAPIASTGMAAGSGSQIVVSPTAKAPTAAQIEAAKRGEAQGAAVYAASLRATNGK